MLDIDRPGAPDVRTRTPRAAWISPALHLAVAVIVGVAARPDSEPAPTRPDDRPPPRQLVWLERDGPERGGGKRADGKLAPARRAEGLGQERVHIPAARPRSFAPKPAPEPPPPPPQEITIPVLPEVSGLRDVPGTISEVSVTLTAGGGPDRSAGSGPGDGSGLDAGRGGNQGGGWRGPGSGLEPPQLIRQVRPNYTSSALQARVRGVVVMDAVVMPDGSVGDVKIVRSLDSTFGLDQEAIKALKQWRFRAAKRAGNTIAMLVSVEMLFELR
jgi:protein TonB